MILLIKAWIRIIFKIIFSRLPINYHAWKKLNLFVHGNMNSPDYAFDVFNHHYLKAKNYLSNNFVLCELGPGDSLYSGFIGKCFGSSKVILVDDGDYATKEMKHYNNLRKYLINNHQIGDQIDLAGNIDTLLNDNNIEYLTNGLEGLKKIKTDSIDFLFSNAVLEHIPINIFVEMQQEIYRIIKPTGIISHRIDLRDHIGGGLNNLRFSNKVWESNLFKKSGFYTNRLRFYQLIKIFKDSGFDVEINTIDKWDKLPIRISRISKDIKISNEDLHVSIFDVLLNPK